MPASPLRDAHLQNLRAAVSSYGTVSPDGGSSPMDGRAGSAGSRMGHVSSSEWLRHQSQMIKEVDPSFDPSLLCPISFSPTTAPASSAPSPSSTPCSPQPPFQLASASPPRGSPSSPSEQPSFKAKASPSHSPALLRALRAITIEDDSRNLVRSASEPVERAQRRVNTPSTSPSGPLNPSHMVRQQQANAAKARFNHHRLREASSPVSRRADCLPHGGPHLTEPAARNPPQTSPPATSQPSRRRRSLDGWAKGDAELARTEQGLAGSRPRSSAGPSASCQGETDGMHPCMNFQDVRRASLAMDEAGDVIEGITIIPVDDRRHAGERGEGQQGVLFAITRQGNAKATIPGFTSNRANT